MNLELIILDGATHAMGIVKSPDSCDFRSVKILDCDFRSVKILGAESGRPIYQVVSRMLVFPSGVSTGLPNHFEDRIRPQRLVRPQSYTVAVWVAVPRQFGRIDHVQRNVLGVVLVDALIKNHHVARSPGAGCVRGIEDSAVVADVVKQSGGNRRATRQKSEKSGKRVGILRSVGAGISDGVAGKLC